MAFYRCIFDTVIDDNGVINRTPRIALYADGWWQHVPESEINGISWVEVEVSTWTDEAGSISDPGIVAL